MCVWLMSLVDSPPRTLNPVEQLPHSWTRQLLPLWATPTTLVSTRPCKHTASLHLHIWRLNHVKSASGFYYASVCTCTSAYIYDLISYSVHCEGVNSKEVRYRSNWIFVCMVKLFWLWCQCKSFMNQSVLGLSVIIHWKRPRCLIHTPVTAWKWAYIKKNSSHYIFWRERCSVSQ